MTATLEELTQGAIVRGPFFSAPVEIITAIPLNHSIRLIGKGLRSNRVYDSILGAAQLARLTVTPQNELFDGDATRFRLGIEALRLGLAYEYDPYFSLSIVRVDPLVKALRGGLDGQCS